MKLIGWILLAIGCIFGGCTLYISSYVIEAYSHYWGKNMGNESKELIQATTLIALFLTLGFLTFCYFGLKILWKKTEA